MKRKRENGGVEEAEVKKRKLESDDKTKFELVYDQFKQKKFSLKNVLEFLNNVLPDSPYIRFDYYDVVHRPNNVLYADFDKSGYPGIYCSLIELQTQMIEAGCNPKFLIPSRKVNEWKILKTVASYFVGRKKLLKTQDFVEEEKTQDEIKQLRQYNDKYKDKHFCVKGVLHLLKDCETPDEFVHFTHSNEQTQSHVYFDDKVPKKMGFFINRWDVIKTHEEAGIPQKQQIPRKKVTSYLELLECLRYLNVFQRVLIGEENDDNDNFIILD